MATPDIVFTRIDNRLIHGQVANLWISTVPANLVVVVDDETANDEVLKSVMKITTDAKGVGVRFFTVDKTIEIIGRASPSQHIFLVAKTPAVIRRLVENNIPIKEVNIGNMHFIEGKKVYKESHVYVDQQDLDDIQYLKSKGISVYIQLLPTDHKYTA